MAVVSDRIVTILEARDEASRATDKYGATLTKLAFAAAGVSIAIGLARAASERWYRFMESTATKVTAASTEELEKLGITTVEQFEKYQRVKTATEQLSEANARLKVTFASLFAEGFVKNLDSVSSFFDGLDRRLKSIGESAPFVERVARAISMLPVGGAGFGALADSLEAARQAQGRGSGGGIDLLTGLSTLPDQGPQISPSDARKAADEALRRRTQARLDERFGGSGGFVGDQSARFRGGLSRPGEDLREQVELKSEIIRLSEEEVAKATEGATVTKERIEAERALAIQQRQAFALYAAGADLAASGISRITDAIFGAGNAFGSTTARILNDMARIQVEAAITAGAVSAIGGGFILGGIGIAAGAIGSLFGGGNDRDSANNRNASEDYRRAERYGGA